MEFPVLSTETNATKLANRGPKHKQYVDHMQSNAPKYFQVSAINLKTALLRIPYRLKSQQSQS